MSPVEQAAATGPALAAATRAFRRVGLPWGLLAVLVFGAGVRLAFHLEHTGQPGYDHPTLDALFHDHHARGLAFDDWTLPPGVPDPGIREHPYYRPPGYPALLAGVYALPGGGPTLARVLQHLLGLLSAALAYLLARRLGASPAGATLGAGVLLLSPALVFFEGELVPASLAGLALLVVVALGLWAQRSTDRGPRWARWATFGLVLGVVATLRPNLAVVGPAVGGVAWLTAPRGRRTPTAVAVALAALLSLFPVSLVAARNHAVSGEWVWLSTNGEVTLLYGNNPRATGADMVLPGRPPFDGIEQVSPFTFERLKAQVSRREGRDLSYEELSELFAEEVLRFWREQPGDALALTLRKALLLVGREEVGNNKQVALELESSTVLRWLPGRWFVLFSLAWAGVVAWWLAGRRRSVDGSGTVPPGRAGWATVATSVVLLLGTLVPFLPAARFRVPVEPLLAVLASAALPDRAGGRGLWKGFVLPFAAFGVGLVLTGVNWVGYQPDEARWHVDRASARERAGDLGAARAELEAALEADPHSAEAHIALGYLDARAGDGQRARRHFERALDAGAGARAHAGLAATLTLLGRPELALVHYEAALAEAPDDVAVRYNHGLALFAARRYEAARQAYEAVLARDPGHLDAANNLGRTLLALGRPAAARERFEQVRAARPDDVDARFNVAVATAALDPVEGMRAYRRLLEARPDHTGARTNLASLLLAAGDAEEARRHFQDVALRQPGPAAFFNLALADQALHDDAAALQHLRQARAARQQAGAAPGPSAAELDGQLALLLATSADPARRDLDTARRHAERAVQATDRQDARALLALATVLEAAGKAALAGAVRDEVAALCERRPGLPGCAAPGAATP